ncbi:hypothetical protein SNEBB_011159 [Seison nebaliae]|nr:hypothetical protein SNEBB_011159 [Seison nebaliae]
MGKKSRHQHFLSNINLTATTTTTLSSSQTTTTTTTAAALSTLFLINNSMAVGKDFSTRNKLTVSNYSININKNKNNNNNNNNKSNLIPNDLEGSVYGNGMTNMMDDTDLSCGDTAGNVDNECSSTLIDYWYHKISEYDNMILNAHSTNLPEINTVDKDLSVTPNISYDSKISNEQCPTGNPHSLSSLSNPSVNLSAEDEKKNSITSRSKLALRFPIKKWRNRGKSANPSSATDGDSNQEEKYNKFGGIDLNKNTTHKAQPTLFIQNKTPLTSSTIPIRHDTPNVIEKKAKFKLIGRVIQKLQHHQPISDINKNKNNNPEITSKDRTHSDINLSITQHYSTTDSLNTNNTTGLLPSDNSSNFQNLSVGMKRSNFQLASTYNNARNKVNEDFDLNRSTSSHFFHSPSTDDGNVATMATRDNEVAKASPVKTKSKNRRLLETINDAYKKINISGTSSKFRSTQQSMDDRTESNVDYQSEVDLHQIDEPPSNINALPEKILIKIFSQLRIIDDELPRYALVCRKWRRILATTPNLWRHLILKKECSKLTRKHLSKRAKKSIFDEKNLNCRYIDHILRYDKCMTDSRIIVEDSTPINHDEEQAQQPTNNSSFMNSFLHLTVDPFTKNKRRSNAPIGGDITPRESFKRNTLTEQSFLQHINLDIFSDEISSRGVRSQYQTSIYSPEMRRRLKLISYVIRVYGKHIFTIRWLDETVINETIVFYIFKFCTSLQRLHLPCVWSAKMLHLMITSQKSDNEVDIPLTHHRRTQFHSINQSGSSNSLFCFTFVPKIQCPTCETTNCAIGCPVRLKKMIRQNYLIENQCEVREETAENVNLSLSPSSGHSEYSNNLTPDSIHKSFNLIHHQRLHATAKQVFRKKLFDSKSSSIFSSTFCSTDNPRPSMNSIEYSLPKTLRRILIRGHFLFSDTELLLLGKKFETLQHVTLASCYKLTWRGLKSFLHISSLFEFESICRTKNEELSFFYEISKQFEKDFQVIQRSKPVEIGEKYAYSKPMSVPVIPITISTDDRDTRIIQNIPSSPRKPLSSLISSSEEDDMMDMFTFKDRFLSLKLENEVFGDFNNFNFNQFINTRKNDNNNRTYCSIKLLFNLENEKISLFTSSSPIDTMPLFQKLDKELSLQSTSNLYTIASNNLQEIIQGFINEYNDKQLYEQNLQSYYRNLIEHISRKINSSKPSDILHYCQRFLQNKTSNDEWNNAPQRPFFVSEYVTNIHIHHVHNMTTSQIWLLQKALFNLRKLIIKNCGNIETLPIHSETIEILRIGYLFDCKQVVISNCQKLRYCYYDIEMSECRVLIIDNTPNLQKLLIDGNKGVLKQIKLLGNFQLKLLEMRNCHGIQSNDFIHFILVPVMQELKALRLGALKNNTLTINEKNECSMDKQKSLNNLEYFQLLEDCNLITIEIFNAIRISRFLINNCKHLKTIRLRSRGHICYCQIISCPELDMIDISCDSIDYFQINSYNDSLINKQFNLLINCLGSAGIIRIFYCEVQHLQIASKSITVLALIDCEFNSNILRKLTSGNKTSFLADTETFSIFSKNESNLNRNEPNLINRSLTEKYHTSSILARKSNDNKRRNFNSMFRKPSETKVNTSKTNINNSNNSQNSFTHLSSLPNVSGEICQNIRHLCIESCFGDWKHITLRNLTNLKYLNLRNSRVAHGIYISHCSNLRAVNLSDCTLLSYLCVNGETYRFRKTSNTNLSDERKYSVSSYLSKSEKSQDRSGSQCSSQYNTPKNDGNLSHYHDHVETVKAANTTNIQRSQSSKSTNRIVPIPELPKKCSTPASTRQMINDNNWYSAAARRASQALSLTMLSTSSNEKQMIQKKNTAPFSKNSLTNTYKKFSVFARNITDETFWNPSEISSASSKNLISRNCSLSIDETIEEHKISSGEKERDSGFLSPFYVEGRNGRVQLLKRASYITVSYDDESSNDFLNNCVDKEQENTNDYKKDSTTSLKALVIVPPWEKECLWSHHPTPQKFDASII